MTCQRGASPDEVLVSERLAPVFEATSSSTSISRETLDAFVQSAAPW